MEADISIFTLKEKELQKMIRRAIASGKAHGINLKHGRANPGNGDCAIEATSYNNNDRLCFKTKYTLPISFCRKIWTTDMANKTVERRAHGIQLVQRHSTKDGKICLYLVLMKEGFLVI